VGLKGSADIANNYKKNGVDVYGVFQADMIGYTSDENNRHISIIDDYVNKDLTNFLTVSCLMYIPFFNSNCKFPILGTCSWVHNNVVRYIPMRLRVQRSRVVVPSWLRRCRVQRRFWHWKPVHSFKQRHDWSHGLWAVSWIHQIGTRICRWIGIASLNWINNTSYNSETRSNSEILWLLVIYSNESKAA